ncbi:calcium-binding protein [Campylobacter geochelonis]|uniref:calcium-binding protein n=1 Tax=Campylobacter geochelonis TaxID=1780362 RepID=UPI00265CE77B|nr:calcium-binding protein [Campylobacter geochelonis]QKF71488.1 RTX toxin-related calcium-binding protein (peptidase M10 serralysin domains) [Campylobacter geochelonis]
MSEKYLHLVGDYALEVLSWYLWGEKKRPNNIVDEKYGNRNKNKKGITINVSVSEFMSRYFQINTTDEFKQHVANIPMFKIFFENKGSSGRELNFDEYKYKIDGNNQIKLKHSEFVKVFYGENNTYASNPQVSFSIYKQNPSTVEDFAQAAFVFGLSNFTFNTNYELAGSDGIQYVFDINTDGSIKPSHIENLKFTLNTDNFDFESDSLLAGMLNPTLKKITDPNNIGKAVEIKFINDFYPTNTDINLNLTVDEFKNLQELKVEYSEYEMLKFISDYADRYLYYFKKIVYSNIIDYSAEDKYLVYGNEENNNNIRNTITKNEVDLSKTITFDNLVGLTSSIVNSIILSYNPVKLISLIAIRQIVDNKLKEHGFTVNSNINPHKDKLSNGIIYLLGDGSDSATGTNKNDILIGGHGSDTLSGKGGDDYIYVGKRDKNNKDDGTDILSNSAYGGSGDDYIFGSSGNDALSGGLGDDTIYGNSGDDTLYADIQLAFSPDLNDDSDATEIAELIKEFDTVKNTNYLYGGSGSDTLVGSRGKDYLYAAGKDSSDSAKDTNTLIGKSGDDFLYGSDGINYLLGGAGSDTIEGGLNTNYIYTHASSYTNPIDEDKQSDANTVTAGDSTNYIYGGKGKDTITVGNGNNTINAGDGDDAITAGNGDNYIATGKGKDTITTGNGNNTIYAGLGKDSITTGSGDDKLYAGDDKDADELSGGSGDDEYHVSANDIINDSDGKGRVWFKHDSPITGGIETKPGSKVYTDNRGYTYQLNGSELKVTYNLDKDSITIKNYNQEQNSLGITLTNKVGLKIKDVTENEGSKKATITLELIGEIVGDGKLEVFMRSSDMMRSRSARSSLGAITFKKGDTTKTYSYDIKDYDDFIVNNEKRRFITNLVPHIIDTPSVKNSVSYDSSSSKYGELNIVDDDKPVYINVRGNSTSEAAEIIRGMVGVNRGLKVSANNQKEYVSLNIGSNKFKFIGGYTQDIFTASKWTDDEIEEEDSKFYVSPYHISSNATVYYKGKGARFAIFDDDKDKDYPDPEDETSPLVIDLNKDGIKTTNLKNSVFFDLDNNDFKEKTAWLDKNDAFLAIDKNNNGIIDNANELFGNNTIINSNYNRNDKTLDNGFEVLKRFDTNNDGIINALDMDYDKLLLWQDVDKNGISTKDELYTLSNKAIKSIDLNYKNVNIDSNSNTIKQLSKVSFYDGTTTDIADVWFRVEPSKTISNANVELPQRLREFVDIEGGGNLEDFLYVVAKNKELEDSLRNYVETTDEKQRKEKVNSLIFKWAGVEDIDSSSRGGIVDARELAVYEKLIGRQFLQLGTDPNPRENASAIIHSKYQRFANYVYASLELDIVYKGMINTEYMKLDNDTGAFHYDFSGVNKKFQELYANNKRESISHISTLLNMIAANKPNFKKELDSNYLISLKDNQELMALAFNRYQKAQNSGSTLYGTSDSDFLQSANGDDILAGGYGDDIYKFDTSFGKDSIFDDFGNDTIVFAEGIDPKDIKLKRNLANLTITHLGKDCITIENFFDIAGKNGNGSIEGIKFDKEIWDFNKILQMAPLEATSGNDSLYLTNLDDKFNAIDGDDTIYGGDGNDIIDGGSGDDGLYADEGDDILVGGVGDDTLSGGAGNDTYIFGKNFGNDTIINNNTDNGIDKIKFIDGINLKDVIFKQVDSDLFINLKDKNNKNSIKILDFLAPLGNGNLYNTINMIEFSDGKLLSLNDIVKQSIKNTDESANTISVLSDDSYVVDAKGGDDVIVTKGGNDTLIGGAGNDTLQGGLGNDTYIFGKEFGKDVIINNNPNALSIDTIKFIDGISKDDILFSIKDNDLVITLKNNQENFITIKEFYKQEYGVYNNTITSIEFDDLATMHLDDINKAIIDNKSSDIVKTISSYGYDIDKSDSKVGVSIDLSNGDDSIVASSFNDTIHSNSGNDIINGGSGDDYINAGAGNDIITGGKGNDSLQGGKGNDTYVFGKEFGKDVVINYKDSINEIDIIKFIDGIRKEDLIFKQTNLDLTIAIKDTNDSILIQNFYKTYTDKADFIINKIEFDDKSFLNLKDINELAFEFIDNDSNLVSVTTNDNYLINISKLNNGKEISTLGGNDIITGSSGDDIINAGAGNDIITGGKGNDTLQSAKGNDTYVFGKEFGKDIIVSIRGGGNGDKDKIKFIDGIRKEDLLFTQDKLDLIISLKNSNDSIVVENFYSIYRDESRNKISLIEFDDLTTLSLKRINELALLGSSVDKLVNTNDDYTIDKTSSTLSLNIATLKGNDTIKSGSGDDSINAGDGNDTIMGGVGNDTINGGAGNDVYVFGWGFGQDTIINHKTNTNEIDTIKFVDGIRKNDLIFRQDGLNLIISLKHSNDFIIIENFYKLYEGTSKHIVDKIEFDDNSSLNIKDINELALKFIDNSSDNVLVTTNDNYEVNLNKVEKGKIITTLGGNDNIISSDKNDTINSGSGDDKISANDGNDKIYALSGADYIDGGMGDDYIDAGSGDDVLIGGAGNDILLGGNGSDRYVFDKDFGNDIVINKKDDYSFDIIEFIDNTTKDDLIFKQINLDLKIYHKSSNSSITVKEFYTIDNNKALNTIDQILFKDGSYINLKEINQLALNHADDDSIRLDVVTNDNYTLSAGAKDDSITMLGGDDYINSNEGNDGIFAGAGKDYIDSGSGDDYIDSGSGDDILVGGAGNDRLIGSSGDDIYRFFKGFGKDTIINQKSTLEEIDTIEFADGIKKDDVIFKQKDDNLVISLKDSGDSIEVINFFKDVSFTVDRVKFSDGSLLSLKDMIYLSLINTTQGDDKISVLQDDDYTIYAKGGNDTVITKGGDDYIDAGMGDDYIDTGAGDDILIGGSGNDILIGGSGNDRYVFNSGFGKDIIDNAGFGYDKIELDNIKAQDLSFIYYENKDELIITLKNSDDSISVKNFVKEPIEEIVFSNNEKLYKQDIINKATIIGSDDEIVMLKDGIFNAKTGDDIYNIAKLGINVVIDDKFSIFGIDRYSGNNTLKFGMDIDKNDLSYKIDKKDLNISLKDNPSTNITIKNFFDNHSLIETLKFSDNSSLNLKEVVFDKFKPVITSSVFNLNEDSTLDSILKVDNPLNTNLTYELVSSASNSTFDLKDDASFKLIPNLNFNGKDSITLKVTNEYGMSSTKKIVFDIAPINDAPMFESKHTIYELNDIRDLNFVLKADDIDSDNLTFSIKKDSLNGNLTIGDNGAFSYKPNKLFIGKDSAIIIVSDTYNAIDEILVEFDIKVSSPVIKTDILNISEDKNLVANIDIINKTSSNLTYEILNSPLNLKANLDKDNNLSLIPNLNYNGSDSITLKVTNEYGLSDIKTISLEVAPVNDAPEFKELITAYELKNTSTISSSFDAFDVDGNKLSYKIIKDSKHGVISLDDSGVFSYTKDTNFIGKDSAIVEVSDGKLTATKELIFNSLGYQVDSNLDITILPNQTIDTTLKLSNSYKEDISFIKDSENLIIKDSVTNSSITLKEYFTSKHLIKEISFKDKTTVNISNENLSLVAKQWWQINPQARLNTSGVIVSNTNNSILYGSGKNDTIISTSTNSTIRSYEGDDFIYAKDNNTIYSYSGNDTIISYNNDIVYAGNDDDTLISKANNSTLQGENGNDTYIITKEATNTTIKDKELINLIEGGDDTLILKGVKKEEISFKLDGVFMQDLVIRYGSDNNTTLTIKNQTNKYSQIETIKLDDNSFISNEQIDKIIQQVNAYTSDNGISNITHDEARNNQAIMQIYASGWGS